MIPKTDVDDQIWHKAASLFNISLKSLDADVLSLQEWINTQSHLPNLLNSHCLRNFLLLNKCSVELAKQKIENYYIIRSKLGDIKQINPKLPHKDRLNEIAYVVLYPQLTNDLYRICYFKFRNENVIIDEYYPMDLMKKTFSLGEIRLRQDVFVGDIIIADLKGVPLAAVLKTTPSMIRKGVVIYEKIFTMRIKGIYLLNMPPFFTTILTLVKALLKPKLFERIHICSSMDSLKETFPSDLLPREFGGDGFSLDVLHEAQEATFKEYQDVFDCLDNINVDESLIPKKTKGDEIMGIDGNFKKLEID